MSITSNHLQQYLDLLEELDALILNGRGDESEADDLRDRMDVPWRKLSEEERVIVYESRRRNEMTH